MQVPYERSSANSADAAPSTRRSWRRGNGDYPTPPGSITPENALQVTMSGVTFGDKWQGIFSAIWRPRPVPPPRRLRQPGRRKPAVRGRMAASVQCFHGPARGDHVLAVAGSGPRRESIPDMINFCPRSTPNKARRALENVLRRLGCSASTGRPVLIQPPPWARRPYPRANGSAVQTGLRGGRMGKLTTCLDGLGLLQLLRAASPYLTNFFQHG